MRSLSERYHGVISLMNLGTRPSVKSLLANALHEGVMTEMQGFP